MTKKPTAEQVARITPVDGWAGVKFVILPAAVTEANDGTGERVCRFEPPGLPNATAGDVFSLSAEEAEGLRPDLWLRQGLVAIYKEPAKPKKPKDDEGDGDGG